MTDPHLNPNPGFWKRSVGSVSRIGSSKSKSRLGRGDDREGEGGDGADGERTFRFVDGGGEGGEGAGNSKSKEKGKGAESSEELTPKQRRRAQVRKAQIEHRQRKSNLTLHLEREIISLREEIAKAETQAVLFKYENIAIRKTFQDSSVLVYLPPPQTQRPQASTSNLGMDLDLRMEMGDLDLDQDFDMSGTGSGTDTTSNRTTLVHTTFDSFLDEECLQISPYSTSSFGTSSLPSSNATTFTLPSSTATTFPSTNDFNLSFVDPTISLPSPDIFNSASWKPAVLAQQERERNRGEAQAQLKARSLVQRGGGGGGGGNASTGVREVKMSEEEEREMRAVNWILALEHPCRTHFTPRSPTDSSKPFDAASATGHEMMATTHLFSHASSFSHPNSHVNTHTHPQTVEKTAINNTWLIPSPSLQSLYAMSSSLPKGNWEITPVQAWFLLVGRYGWEGLLSSAGKDGVGLGSGGREEGSVMEKLKRGLAKLVSCQEFGSVMDEVEFWGVVGGIFGEV